MIDLRLLREGLQTRSLIDFVLAWYFSRAMSNIDVIYATFGDHKLFAYLADLGFAYVIRFRGNIHVTDASGETRTAANWA